ncbi:MAG: COX15/CtaA family protein [Armatimonadetes bacterium]|nr:COX15/CtaA family protein [Armatimonadota bacterium]
MTLTRFSKFAVFVLVFNLLVIVWGAYVRHTGSGAGCGSHWPLCNGEVFPRSPRLETIIEYSHRLMSGLTLLFVIALVVFAFRAFPKGHGSRAGSVLSLTFTIFSALIGAGLVLFGLVELNDSMARAVTLSAHLINTMLLLGALTLTAWWGAGGKPVQMRGQGAAGWLVAGGSFAVLLVGMSGAVTSLGDTLFPRDSSAQVIQEGLSVTGHFLIRLRLWHPFIAVCAGMYLFFMAAVLSDTSRNSTAHALLRLVVALVLTQIGLGLISVWLKAPTALALLHLFLADLLWIATVLAGAAVLSTQSRDARVVALEGSQSTA